MSGTPIAVIPKNQREEIRVELSEYKGHDPGQSGEGVGDKPIKC
jgi:hypothetical protein